MSIREKPLGQVEPLATTNTTLYDGPVQATTIVKQIMIVNTHATVASDIRIFHDIDGTSATTAEAQVYDHNLVAQTHLILDVYWPVDPGGRITVYTSQATVTFTAYGVEIS